MTIPIAGARYYALDRDVDVSGVSGTGRKGYVIEMVEYGVLLVWDTDHHTVDWRPDMAAVHSIHGHDGKTRFTPVDDDEDAVAAAHALLGKVYVAACATLEAAGVAFNNQTASSA